MHRALCLYSYRNGEVPWTPVVLLTCLVLDSRAKGFQRMQSIGFLPYLIISIVCGDFVDYANVMECCPHYCWLTIRALAISLYHSKRNRCCAYVFCSLDCSSTVLSRSISEHSSKLPSLNRVLANLNGFSCSAIDQEGMSTRIFDLLRHELCITNNQTQFIWFRTEGCMSNMLTPECWLNCEKTFRCPRTFDHKSEDV